MGENFTGVKNEILTRLAVCAGGGSVVVAAAADLALVQPQDLAAQLAGKGARPAVFMVGPNVLYRSKHIPGSVFAGPGRNEDGPGDAEGGGGQTAARSRGGGLLRVLPVGPVPERQASGGFAESRWASRR